MDPGGGTGCGAAELCFEDSGTVSPRKSHSKAASPPEAEVWGRILIYLWWGQR